MRKFAIGVICWAVWPIGLWLLTNIGATAVWCIAWVALSTWFLFSKQDTATRGLWFVTVSVMIAFVGRYIVGASEHELVLDSVQNVMLLIGGGVGGNFMAAGMLEADRKEAKKALSDKGK